MTVALEAAECGKHLPMLPVLLLPIPMGVTQASLVLQAIPMMP
jgi:hypothetical protein